MRRSTAFSAVLSTLLVSALAEPLGAQGVAIGFEEDFALARDREAVLAELVPGSQEAYFYRCLHLQNERRLDAVPPLLAEWIERYGRSARVDEIENRQFLLDYERDPKKAFEQLQQRLGLRFDHQREETGARPDLPTRLDPASLEPAALYKRALELHPSSLDGVRDRALPALAATELDATLLHDLLRRLERPDVPGLARLVVRDLERPRSEPFGSLELHGKLLLEQLEECAELRPALLESDAFVAAWIVRLQPSADVDWRRDPRARLEYLARLEEFVNRLSPAHDSLKAHVLYHRLAHDLGQGAPDKPRLLAYLRLPRTAPYANRERLKDRGSREAVVDLNRDFPTGLGPVKDDEPVVRAWLEHFFREEDSWEPYTEFLDEAYVRKLFAETKLLAGQGDLERWTALVDDAGWLEALRQRIEIQFAPTQPPAFRADEPVALEVDVKNVDTLLVKVFEIDAFNYYRAKDEEVDQSIQIDGLVPNVELTQTYTEGPLRRVRRRIDLPQLSKPGVYVVELIGNGLSSRAVIRKGALQLLERDGSAGHVLRILDEQGRAQPDATLWLGAREYAPDERGEIVVPYSTGPDSKSVILKRGELASLARFTHHKEEYALSAEVYTERESLLSGRRAKLIVGPRLSLNGKPIPIELLDEPRLQLTSTDGQDTKSSQEVRGLTLSSAGELVHEFQVPEGLRSLEVVLRGRVRVVSRSEDTDLESGSRSFALNQIDSTELTTAPLLGRSDRGWNLDLLGRNGEPKANRAMTVELDLRDFVDPLQLALRSDERGRIELGPLEGVVRVSIEGLSDGKQSWLLPAAQRSWPASVHGVAGTTLRIPYVGRATTPSRSAVSMLELRGDLFAHDAFEHCAIREGFLELTGLAAGDYDLWLPESGQGIAVRITAGELQDRWAIGKDRWLELDRAEPLQIVDLQAAKGELTVRLANATDRSRVHVIASRYVFSSAYDSFERLRAGAIPPLALAEVQHGAASYDTGRQISDEYRYILERRFARRFPGNMLSRPGLLLNPWSLAESLMPLGRGTSAFSSRRAGGGGRGGGGLGQGGVGHVGKGTSQFRSSLGILPDLDFLPEPAHVLTNLRAGADGVVHVPLADLGPGQFVQVVAIDGDTTAYSTLALPEKPLVPVDRRLMRPLDPAQHFAEQEQIVRVEAGASSTIEDVGSSKAESYDSLTSVFRLFRTLSGMEELDRFEFLTRWPGLAREAKLELYSKHACHELHFFLWNKDPQFFAEIVRPYLAQKVHKTFLDHWLLEDDLARYLEPAAFARLNTVERILLTGRLAGRREDGARHLREAVELLPRDPERARRLFEAALAGAALDTDSALRSELAAGIAKPPTAEVPDQAEAPAEQEAKKEGIIAQAQAQGFTNEVELERARREQVRELYRAPDPTKAWAESNYWKLPIERQDAALVQPNAFWLDYAAREPNAPFLSTHFTEAAGTLTEMLLALSVLDLPFKAGEHAIESGEGKLTMRAASPLLLARRDIHAATPLHESEPPLLLSQNLLRLDDRWRVDDDGQQREAYVSGELTVDVPYACQVVATNPTSAHRRLDLLLQVPEGSLPVGGGSRTKSVEVELGPYSTHQLEYSFYFPSPGTYRHYPVHASSDGAFVAAAPATTWTVVAVPTAIDTTSWQHVSQVGSEQEVFDYLERANLQRIDLSKLAWRMQERAFFERLLALLRRRLVFQPELWSYGIRHHDADATREYLAQRGDFLAKCGRWLESPLVSIDPVERRDWQLIEFEPLFNARAHPFGGRREVLDASLASQYLALLEILAYRPALDDVDHMALTYYLLLQDRIADALAQFEQVDPARLVSRLQYDYMRAYMDFFTDEHAVAREMATGYRDYPVKRWRERFSEVVRQLDEAAGAAITGAGKDDRTRRQTELASSGPSLELEVQGRQVRVGYRNLESCEVRYYPLDVEFQFSASPFARNDDDAALFVRPRRTDPVALAKDQTKVAFDLPDDLAGANLLVEVRGGGLVRRQAAYASTLDVQTFESYGQLAVRSSSSGTPLSKVYVKVYARAKDKVRFYKDGYTDLRGRFDYASLSEQQDDKPDRFAILVLSDTQGAALREVSAPLK